METGCRVHLREPLRICEFTKDFLLCSYVEVFSLDLPIQVLWVVAQSHLPVRLLKDYYRIDQCRKGINCDITNQHLCMGVLLKQPKIMGCTASVAEKSAHAVFHGEHRHRIQRRGRGRNSFLRGRQVSGAVHETQPEQLHQRVPPYKSNTRLWRTFTQWGDM